MVAQAGPGGDSPPLPSEGKVRMSCLVARDGATGWTMRLPNGDVVDQPPTDGRLIDCLRRCFALPTSPPPVTPARLQTAAWLASIQECARGSSRSLTWSEGSRLHPVARLLSGDLDRDCANLMSGIIRIAGAAWTWEDFRLQALQEGCLDEFLDRELTDWMDEGMFSRWILATLPSLDEMMSSIRPVLVPSAARRLAHAVKASAQPLETNASA
jgi:hypothetical protein